MLYQCSSDRALEKGRETASLTLAIINFLGMHLFQGGSSIPDLQASALKTLEGCIHPNSHRADAEQPCRGSHIS